MKTKILLSLCILISLISFGCNFFTDVNEIVTEDYDSKITAVTFDKTSLSMKVDESDYIKLTLTPADNQGKCNISWEYDKEYISVQQDNFGAVISGLKAGNTYIKAKCNGIVATCLITLEEDIEKLAEEPYIYTSSSDIIEMKPLTTKNISVSLYGGTLPDMEDFVFEVVNPDVIDVVTNRNNCIIQSKKAGSTQIKVTHPKAEYHFSFTVFVYDDVFKETYITTQQNILAIDKNKTPEASVSVSLVNPKTENTEKDFVWDYYDDNSKEIVSIVSQGSNAIITGKKNGIAKIVVSHPDAKYPLEINVRVISIVENVYISLSNQTVNVKGNNEVTVYASIENYNEFVDVESFVWEFPEEAKDIIDYQTSGNSLLITGKKNGVVRCTVSHELSEKARTLLIICSEQMADAIDSSMYITTSQNFLQTKVGSDSTTIDISLIGGNIGDENDFVWKINEKSGEDVLEVNYVTGTTTITRSAISSGKVVGGKLIFTPKNAGEVEIEVSHKKSLYPVTICVKVFSEYVLLEPPVEITSDISLIKMLNGESTDVSVGLKNAQPGEENNLTWTSENSSVISVSPTQGNTTQISAIGSGKNQTYVIASYEKALYDKKILVLTADTQEELDSFKTIYTSKNYYRLNENSSINVSLETIGLEDTDKIAWSVDDSSICIVESSLSSKNYSQATFTGIKVGKTNIRATFEDIEVVFDIVILKEDETIEYIEPPRYLTTNANAIVFEELNEIKDIQVTGVNISDIDSYNTSWTYTAKEGEEDAFLFSSNGFSSSVESLKYGKGILTVSNPLSKNKLDINLKCGELYEWSEDFIIYIDGDDVVNITKGTNKIIGFSLVNTTDFGVFSFKIKEGEELIELVPTTNGLVTINAIEAGQAVIEVTNSLTDFPKEVLINIANTEEELKGIRYLSTKDNVVTISSQGQKTVNVEVINADNPIITGFNWTSLDDSIVEVVSSGSSAVLYGKKEGTAKVKITNTNCDIPLEIIVNVVNPVLAMEDPYIMCQNISTVTIGGDNLSLVAELIGGSEEDNINFSWSILDPSIATLVASNNSAMITGLKEGITQIQISHPKSSLSRTVTLIVEKKITSNCYININTGYYYQVKPGEAPLVIAADLINGTEDDIYDFNFYADSYDLINFNYTSNTCVIEPLSTGIVTIHVTHPKSQNSKDITVYISKYEGFAFEKKNVVIQTKANSYVNMELPATAQDCTVSYSSSDDSICGATGNESVCILKPGVPNGDENSVTITASLIKNNVVIATAELLVVVEEVNEAKPYISSKETVIILNQGEKRTISASLNGNNIVDTTNSGLKWTIQNTNGPVVSFSSPMTTGPSVQIEAINSGKTTITIEHNEAPALVLYVIVSGTADPTISLSHTSYPIYIGENVRTLTATVTNTESTDLVWEVIPKEQDFFTLSTSGTKASILATNPGKATIVCSLPGDGLSASCDVIIKETEKIELFVYDDEVEKNKKLYITNLQMSPGETKIVHYETVPEKDKLSRTFLSNDNVILTLFDYGEDVVMGSTTYEVDDNVGSIAITAKEREGSSTLQVYSASQKSANLIINNSYGYQFVVDKTIINTTPAELEKNSSLLYVNYQLRPETSRIDITFEGNPESYKNLRLKEGSYYSSSKTDSDYVNHYVINSHTKTDVSASTGIVTGILKFEADGEVNCEVKVSVTNYEISGSNVVEKEFATKTIKIKSVIGTPSFDVQILRDVPYLNYDAYATNEMCGLYSKYDKTTKSIVLGDGEYLTLKATVKEPLANLMIQSVNFSKAGSSSERNYVACTSSNDVNEVTFNLYHTTDYGWVKYTKSNGASSTSKVWHSSYKANDIENEAEKTNTTVRENAYVGTIEINYYSVIDNTYKSYSIPVYVVCRNAPCANNTKYTIGN